MPQASCLSQLGASAGGSVASSPTPASGLWPACLVGPCHCYPPNIQTHCLGLCFPLWRLSLCPISCWLLHCQLFLCHHDQLTTPHVKTQPLGTPVCLRNSQSEEDSRTGHNALQIVFGPQTNHQQSGEGEHSIWGAAIITTF